MRLGNRHESLNITYVLRASLAAWVFVAAGLGCGTRTSSQPTALPPTSTMTTVGGYHFILPADPANPTSPLGWKAESKGPAVICADASGTNALEIRGGRLSWNGKPVGVIEPGDTLDVSMSPRITINGKTVSSPSSSPE